MLHGVVNSRANLFCCTEQMLPAQAKYYALSQLAQSDFATAADVHSTCWVSTLTPQSHRKMAPSVLFLIFCDKDAIMKTIIYSPSSTTVQAGDDADVANAITGLLFRYAHSQAACHDTQQQLRQLADGGSLFIVAHGDANRIGAQGHGRVSAAELVAQLLDEGLPINPRNRLHIHLYACSSPNQYANGASPSTQSVYLLQFCQELIKAGCGNFNMIGSIGFLRHDAIVQAISTSRQRQFRQAA